MAKIPEHEIADHLDNQDTPSHTIHQIVEQQPGKSEFASAADHPNTAEHTLYHMHTEAPKHFDAKAAPGEYTDTANLSQFQENVAAHPNAPKGIVKEHFDKIKPEEGEISNSQQAILTHPKIDMHEKEKKVASIIKDNTSSEDSDVSYDARSLARKHFEQKGLSAPHIAEHINHPSDSIASAAFKSPSALPEHEKAYVNRKETGIGELREAASKNDIHPDTLHAIHNKVNEIEASSGEDADYWGIKNAKQEILENKNAPKEIIEKYANGPSEESDLRTTALQHPAIDRNRVHSLVTSGDKDAFAAANQREDTGPETLRHIAENSDLGKYGGDKASAIKHKNFPEDLQMQYAKKDTDHQRALLGREELSTPVLKELINSKNKNVAIDALKHKSVNSDVVEAAYGRKMAEVSRAASQHPLASAKMKTAKASTDPVAAQELAHNSTDPDVLHSIHEAHPDNMDIHKRLVSNKNTSSKTIAGIAEKHLAGDTFSNEQRWNDPKNDIAIDLAKHPSLPEEQRRKIAKSSVSSAVKVLSNENISSPEIHDALETHKRLKDQDNSNYHYLVSNALEHKNLSPETAKGILSGEYGDLRMNDNAAKRIDVHGPSFNKDAIMAGINTDQPELSNKALTEHLASSKHLSSEDINKELEKTKAFDTPDINSEFGQDREKQRHEEARRKGFAKNPNLSPEKIDEFLNKGNQPSGIIGAALNNPNLKEEHLKKFYTQDPESTNVSRDHLDDLSKKIKEKGLTDHALANTKDQRIASTLIQRSEYSPGLSKEKSTKFLENPDKKMVADTLLREARDYQNTQKYKDPEHQLFIDSLATHKDKELATKMYPYMSKDAQAKMESNLDYNDPRIIKGSKPEAVSKLKITKDTPEEAMHAITSHSGVTTQHKLDAIEHFPDSAKEIMQEAEGDEGKQIQHKMLDMHNEDNDFAIHAAQHTDDPEILSRITKDHDKFETALPVAASNPNISTKDLDSLKKLPVPKPDAEDTNRNHDRAIYHAAKNPKASADLLAHIAKNYPEHLQRVASNPKVGSTKSVKAVMDGIEDMPMEDSHQIRMALADNPKVPQDVKAQLFKDPHVLFEADPSNVTSEHIEEHSQSNDPSVLSKVLSHEKLNDKGFENLTNKALELHEKEQDPEKKQHIHDVLLEDIARRSTSGAQHISPELAKKVADTSPENAGHVISRHEMSEEHHNDLINKHGNDPGFLDRAVKSPFLSPKSASNLIDKIPDDSNSSDYIDEMLNHSNYEYQNKENEDFKKSTDDLYHKILSRVSSGDKIDFGRSDGRLLDKISSHAGDSIISKIAHHPQLRSNIFQNENASEKTIRKAIDSIHKEGSGLNKPSAYRNLPEFGRRQIEGIFENKSTTPETIDYLVDTVYKQHDKNTTDKKEQNEDIEQITQNASNPKLSTASIEKIYDREGHRYPELLRNPNASDKMMKKAKDIIESPGDQEQTAVELARNPKFSLSSIDMTKADPKTRNALVESTMRNDNATTKQLDEAYANRHYLEGGSIDRSYSSLIKNPNLSEDTAMKLLDNPEIEKEDLYNNPKIGGKLFRADKHPFPSSVGVEKGKEVNEAKYTPGSQKVSSIVPTIPKDGYLDWAEFKKANPKLAGDPIVQKMFTSAPKARLTKEHAEKFINDMPSKKFHVSYKTWDGMQRHNNKKQLVVGINKSEEIENEIKKDPDLFKLYHLLHAGSLHSSHPVNPQSVGWSRVDTSNPDHWFVDEIQSDFDSQLSKEMKAIEEQGKQGLLQSKYGLTTDQVLELAPKLKKTIQGWEEALMNNIMETAKKHGVKKVSIHSGNTKTIMNKGEKAEVTNKYNRIYNELPQKLGFESDKYNRSNVPTASKKDIMDEDIWTKDLKKKEKEVKKSVRQVFTDSIARVLVR